jgi:hypothetical protein
MESVTACALANQNIHSAQRGCKDLRMLDHLIDFTPDVEPDSTGVLPLAKAHPANAVDGKVETADWLKSLGAAGDEVLTEMGAEASRQAFSNLVTGQAHEQTHAALAKVQTPAAVQHLVGMLSAYDWEFVERAKEIRGYAVAQLLEETRHPTASVRLKALALLGKVTEVGLFTDKIEVKKSDLSDAELDARIKEKLGKMAKIVEISEVQDVDVKDLTGGEDEQADPES